MLRLREKNVWIVLAAALALLVQSAVGIAAPNHPRGAFGLDAFGNPLCVSDAGHQDHGGHSRLADCCTLGCSMFSPALGAPPEAVQVAPESVLGVATRHLRPTIIHLPEPAYTPGNPRAPPLTA